MTSNSGRSHRSGSISSVGSASGFRGGSGSSGGSGGNGGGLRAELAAWAEQLSRHNQAADAAHKQLQRDLQDQRRALDATFRWLADVLLAQRRLQLEETDRMERSCCHFLNRRSSELRATRDAIVARLAINASSDLDLRRLRDAAAAALEGAGGDAESQTREAAEQLRLRQHRWRSDFEAWLKAAPTVGNAGAVLPPPSATREGRREPGAAPEAAADYYYSTPAPDHHPDGCPLAPVHRPSASWPALSPVARPSARPSAPLPLATTIATDVDGDSDSEGDDPAGHYWSPAAAAAASASAPASASATTSLARRPIGGSDPRQQRQHSPPGIRTAGCPVSIACAGPPENLLYVAEEFEDDLPNRVNVYTAQGRLVGPFTFSRGQDSRPVNPYRLAWCPQSQRLLALSYDCRQTTRPVLVDRHGRPSEPFTAATRTLNLAGLEPMDIATADPPGLAFLCCPGHGIVLLDLSGPASQHLPQRQLGIGAPVAASWSGATQQLAVLHSESQPAFRLSLFALQPEGSAQRLQLAAASTVDFESIDPPLVLWDGPRLLVVKVTDERGGGCLDVHSDAEAPGSNQLTVEATRLLWHVGDRRNPIHCCVCMHSGQRILCVCDRNHPLVITCLL